MIYTVQINDYSYIRMTIPMPMLIPRSPYRDLQMAVSLDFVSFIWKKKEFAVDIKSLYDFPYFLMHIRLFKEVPN